MAKQAPTLSPSDSKEGWTFNGTGDARNLPIPVGGRAATDYPHQSIEEFFVRVHPATKKGAVLRQWVHRYKEDTLDEDTGKLKKVDRKIALSDIETLSYDEAKEMVEQGRKLRLREKATGDGPLSRSPRLTMGAVWELYELDAQQRRDTTVDTVAGHYNRYFQHLASRYLDELDYKFWSTFVLQLRAGRLLVGERIDPHGKAVPDRRGPCVAATLKGVMASASGLYDLAHKHRGLRDVEKGWNPANEARELCGAPNKRKSHIPLNKIAAAWRAADVWCTSWARDMLYLYMLTGLRRSLLTNMQFSEVDWEARSLSISPHKPGAKRNKSKTPENAPDLRIPLSDTAFEILRARRQWAADKDGPVWYATRPVRGRASRGQDVLGPPNADPRSSWEYVEKEALDGMHFMPHDLRRTFATIGGNSDADVVAISLLMLHSGQTVAAKVGVGAITFDYIQTDAAQDRMRKGAIAVEQYILRQLEMFDAGTVGHIDEKPLPELLEEAIGEDED
jgi:integrase